MVRYGGSGKMWIFIKHSPKLMKSWLWATLFGQEPAQHPANRNSENFLAAFVWHGYKDFYLIS